MLNWARFGEILAGSGDPRVMEENVRLYEQQQMAEQAAAERTRNENVDDDDGPPELRNESDDEDDKSSSENSDDDDDDDDDKLLTQLGVTPDKIDDARYLMQVTRTRSWKDDVNKANEALRKEGIHGAIVEVYSPPRIDAMARLWGLLPGMSMDLTSVDPDDGMPWDFTRECKRNKAEKLISEGKHMLLIGSPMCSAFSQLQSLNRARMGEERYQNMIKDARVHLDFCSKLYKNPDGARIVLPSRTPGQREKLERTINPVPCGRLSRKVRQRKHVHDGNDVN